MPSRGGDRDEPRPPEDPRTIHSIKTRMNTKNAVANMAVGIKMVELQLRKAGSAPRRRWLKKVRPVPSPPLFAIRPPACAPASPLFAPQPLPLTAFPLFRFAW